MVTAGRSTKALTIIAALAFAGVGYVTVLRATKAFKQTDFTVYLAAAESVLRGGHDLYLVTNERGWHYNNLPLFAIVMVPFSQIPLFWASVAWYVISVTLAVSAARMCVTMVEERWDRRLSVWHSVLPLCFLAWPLVSALTRGQSSVLVLWLFVASVFSAWKGRDVLCAACLAGAVVLKVFPALLLVYFVWLKQWRLVAAVLSAIALGTFVLPAAVLGFQENLSLLHRWAGVVAQPALDLVAVDPNTDRYRELLDLQWARNQSLQAVVARLTGTARSREIAAGIGLAMATAGVLVFRRGGGSRDLLTVCAIIPWMLLVPPISQTHYFILLLLPLTALVAEAAGTRDPTARRMVRTALMLFGVLGIGGKPIEFYGPMLWGALMLWGVLLMLAKRGTMGTGPERPVAPSAGVA